ncbi:hypothetical protein [uncultured Robinsoniella sp.]|uniref:hypothetical protein n=1 Tax=Robinsoniella sp. TaxID=2496533 RepID=UPI00374F2BA1
MDKKNLPKPPISIDQDRKAAALYGIRKNIEMKKIRYCPSRIQILVIQLQYISKEYWIGQAVAVAAAVMLFMLYGGLPDKMEEYLIGASMLAAAMGLVSVFEISRSLSFHMAELEQSCYLNLGQIWSMKMLISGAIDLCILTGMIFSVIDTMKYSVFALCMYILVPFVLSNACYLLLVSAGRNAGRKWIQIIMSVFLCIGSAIPSVIPKVYRSVYLPLWTIVFILGCILLFIEIYTLLRRLKTGGKELCWS